MHNRLNNIKKMIVEFQRILHTILFERVGEEYAVHEDDSDYFENKFNLLIVKYSKKIGDFTDSDENGENVIFENWSLVRDAILPKKIDTDINFDIENSKVVNVTYINKLDTQSNLLLYYIIGEFIKMFKYNTNKFLKTELINFIYDFTDIIYNYFNDDKIMENIYIRGIMYVIKSTTYINEIESIDKSLIDTISGEYIDNTQQPTAEDIENAEDLKEEADALDMEGEYDYIGEYDKLLDKVGGSL